ncbi:unnamed protein product [[Candida] boidinii]|uniref:Unnamed protein product n=1 Tax=Candida boidinii TaxID=5477 RepID=A0ACB5U1E0_CANBO|nr:unnamed protein product [[Candida] boidinii]
MKTNNISIAPTLSTNITTGYDENNNNVSLTRGSVTSLLSFHSSQPIKRNSVSSSCSSTSTISSIDGFINELPTSSFFKQQSQIFLPSINSFNNNNVFTGGLNSNSNGRIISTVTSLSNFKLPPIQLNLPEDKLGAMFYDSSNCFNNDGNILNVLDRSFR